jgi:integrase
VFAAYARHRLAARLTIRQLSRVLDHDGCATETSEYSLPNPIKRLIKRVGASAGFAFPVHAHMLRHACGYALANTGHDTRRIQMG